MLRPVPLDRLTIESDALRGNQLGDPHVRLLHVWTPPGWDGRGPWETDLQPVLGNGSNDLGKLGFQGPFLTRDYANGELQVPKYCNRTFEKIDHLDQGIACEPGSGC